MTKLADEPTPGPAYRAWLVKQLEAWPKRVDPDKTTNVGYLMNAAAKALRQPDAEIHFATADPGPHPWPADLDPLPDAVPGDLVEERARKICNQFKIDPDEIIDEYGPVYQWCIPAYHIGEAIQSLTARLEMVPGWSQDADGIACRNATIKGLDERIDSLTAERDAALARVAELEAGLVGLLNCFDLDGVHISYSQGGSTFIDQESAVSTARALLEGSKP